MFDDTVVKATATIGGKFGAVPVAGPGSGEEDSLTRGAYRVPRPLPTRTTTPDANLPAFERIGALLSGGIAPREGKVNGGTPEEVADMLFEILRNEGLLERARQ